MTAPVSPMIAPTSQGEEDETPEQPQSNNLTTEVQAPKDFGVLPVPRYLRYDPTKSFHYGLLLNIGFGFACTFLTANLYYCQPLLIQLSIAFGVSYSEVSQAGHLISETLVSSVPSLLQAGFVIGLLLIAPLGDLIRRRQLLLTTITLCICLTIGLAVTNSIRVFQVLSFFVGVTTITPPILVPLAADLAPENKRVGAISFVFSGLLLGILFARVLAGIIAEFTSWHVVYYFAISVQGVVLVWCYFILPDYPPQNKDLTYGNILWTMVRFSVTEPILIQACLINFASSACFSNFWVTLTFLLGGPPYHYSTLVIGLFGLVGMVGVAMGPFVGRLIDNLVPWYATLFAIASIILFQTAQTAAGGVNIAAVVIATIGFDVFRQMIQVSLTTAIFGISLSARVRLNAIFILSSFIGQTMGTSVGTQIFVKFGWRAAAALNMALYGFQLFILLLRGPHCEQYTWFGYEGGLEARKSVVTQRKRLEAERLQAEKTPESSLSTEKVDDNGKLINGRDRISRTGDVEMGLETLNKTDDEQSGPVD